MADYVSINRNNRAIKIAMFETLELYIGKREK